MIDIYNEFNLKPEFSISDNTFKVILPNVNYKEDNNNISKSEKTQKEKIVDYLKEYDVLKRETIDKLFNVSSSRSKAILSELIKEDIIEKIDAGKNTYYVLKG